MMTKKTFQKIQLGVDLTLCSLCVLLTLHNYTFLAAMYCLWILRIWTSMLMYRRSTMAVYSIGLSAVVGLLAFSFSPCTTTIVLDVAKVVISFFGGDGRMMVQKIWEDAREYGYTRTVHHVIGCLTYLWLVVCPLIQYICFYAKKRLVQSSWSRRSSLLLCLYLVLVIVIVIIGSYKDFLSLFIAALGMYTLPYLFKEIDFSCLLTRGEASYIMLLLVLVVCYISGSRISRQAVVAVVALPAVSYAIFNYSCNRRPIYREMALVVLGSMTFWFAQYTTNMFRVLLLILSLGLIGIAVGMFVNATRRKWKGLVLFLVAAFVVPISSLGYNPYSATHTSRMLDYYVGYRLGSWGLLQVHGSNGFGLRDRYGMVLPAEYGSIEFLDGMKPYAKVKEGMSEWRLYDVERKEFVTDDIYCDIYLYGKNVIRLQKDSCELYVKYNNYYHWDSEVMQHVITDTIP